jgi:hypothetical protein
METQTSFWAYQGVIVTMLGLAGGLVSTFLPAGMDVASPPLIRDFLEKHKGIAVIYHILRNTIFGGIASLSIWAGLAQNVNAIGISGQQALTSFAIGGAGLTVLNNLFSSYQRGQSADDIAAAYAKVYGLAYKATGNGPEKGGQEDGSKAGGS